MKISKVIELLGRVKDEIGDQDIGIKILTDDSMIHIKEIKGISSSGFEGLNITNEDECS